MNVEFDTASSASVSCQCCVTLPIMGQNNSTELHQNDLTPPEAASIPSASSSIPATSVCSTVTSTIATTSNNNNNNSNSVSSTSVHNNNDNINNLSAAANTTTTNNNNNNSVNSTTENNWYLNNAVTTQPLHPQLYDSNRSSGLLSTPVLRDRRNIAVSVASQTCCGNAASGRSCTCNKDVGYGRRGIPSNVAIYGTSISPDMPPSSVVVTPPRCLPPTSTPTPPTPSSSPSPPGAVALSNNGCSCNHWCAACRVKVQVEVECVSNEQKPSCSSSRRHSRHLTLSKKVRHKMKSCHNKDHLGGSFTKKKKAPWTLKLNFKSNNNSNNNGNKSEGESSDHQHHHHVINNASFASANTSNSSSSNGFHTCMYSPPTNTPANFDGCSTCVCPGYRSSSSSVSDHDRGSHDHHHHHHHHFHHHHSTGSSPMGTLSVRTPVIDLARFNPDAFPINDLEEVARQERAREMAEGVDPPPGFISLLGDGPCHSLITLPYNSLDLHLLLERSLRLGLGRPRNVATSLTEESLLQQVGRLTCDGSVVQRPVHTQVDYIHCLVPDLLDITNCAFYWGKMDRYEAERLLENRPEGTFLLRDSAQEEYLFSVSFRRYGRSLHARIEQWKHKFSFDSHDPGVFASDTVCGLIEHYKDPSCCMFFEPMLTNPLARTFPFPLQHLCRAAICSTTTYDGINYLMLPKALQNYLKEYHYKQRVRVRRLDH